MTIRKAAQEDHPSIYHLVRTAFATARVSDGTEQDFVLELRRRDAYRPELELVAEVVWLCTAIMPLITSARAAA